MSVQTPAFGAPQWWVKTRLPKRFSPLVRRAVRPGEATQVGDSRPWFARRLSMAASVIFQSPGCMSRLKPATVPPKLPGSLSRGFPAVPMDQSHLAGHDVPFPGPHLAGHQGVNSVALALLQQLLSLLAFGDVREREATQLANISPGAHPGRAGKRPGASVVQRSAEGHFPPRGLDRRGQRKTS